MKPFPVAKLGPLTSLITSGSTPLGGASRYLAEGPVMFVRSQNVRMNCLGLSDVVYIDSALHEEMKRTHVRSGDVFINITGASIGRVAAFDRNGDLANVNQHVCIIRPKPDLLDFRYLTTYLCSPRFQEIINRLQRGGTRQALTFDMIGNFDIPLPHLLEQRRIAAVLDKADAIRRKREEGIRLTEELLRSNFLEMFGDPETNPKGWEIRPLAEVVSEMEGGKSVLADALESETTKYRVLKVSAVTWADYRPHESKPVPAEYVPPPAHIVKQGDLLFSRANTTELVGATVYVFDTPPNHLLPDKLWRFVWRDDRPMDPQYVRMLFMTAAIKRELGRRASGTSGSMKNISKAKLMTIRIPVPPVDLQRAFGRFALAQHKTLTARRDGAEAAEALFGSLVQRAFRGEL
jgi:type I restriction enzyme, S subunit